MSAAVAEEGTNLEEDIALVADEHTNHSDVWVLDSRQPITSVLGDSGSRLMSR